MVSATALKLQPLVRLIALPELEERVELKPEEPEVLQVAQED
jgi:hypothetical protein